MAQSFLLEGLSLYERTLKGFFLPVISIKQSSISFSLRHVQTCWLHDHVALSWHSGLRLQLEEVADQRSVDAQQAQRELELSSRHLANAQQQLQFKADIIHQLTGGLQVSLAPSPLTILLSE